MTCKQEIDRENGKAMRRMWCSMNLELRLLQIIRKPTQSTLGEFQQLIQYAPCEVRERLMQALEAKQMGTKNAIAHVKQQKSKSRRR